MTLILTAACPRWIVQTSDRLITTGEKPFDAISNKTVVYRARDALVTIGYSGIAFVGDQPTDEWLATILWGERPRRSHDGDRPATTMGKAPVSRDIGRAVMALEAAVRSLPAYPVDRHGLYLSIAGWQTKRARSRPVVIELTRNAGDTIVTRTARRWPRIRDFCVQTIGASLRAREIETAFQPFRAKNSLHFEEAEMALIGITRNVAKRHKTVGSHVLSVVLFPPGSQPSLSRFDAATPHKALLRGRSFQSTLTVAHSPWIIGPHLLSPPSMEVGTSIYDLGGASLAFVGERSNGSTLGVSSSVARPRAPGSPRGRA